MATLTTLISPLSLSQQKSGIIPYVSNIVSESHTMTFLKLEICYIYHIFLFWVLCFLHYNIHIFYNLILSKKAVVNLQYFWSFFGSNIRAKLDTDMGANVKITEKCHNFSKQLNNLL